MSLTVYVRCLSVGNKSKDYVVSKMRRANGPAGKNNFFFQFQQITPLRGPREGGTLVTIRGENLGLEFSEIEGNVKVAEVDCTPIREGYIPAEQ